MREVPSGAVVRTGAFTVVAKMRLVNLEAKDGNREEEDKHKVQAPFHEDIWIKITKLK